LQRSFDKLSPSLLGQHSVLVKIFLLLVSENILGTRQGIKDKNDIADRFWPKSHHQ